jgi:N-acetylglutamate synthase-like GNAT family acetyltransferase
LHTLFTPIDLLKGEERLEVEIRTAKREEFEKIARIVRDEIFPELPLDEIRRWIKALGWLKEPFVWWFVAEKEKEMIGCICWALHDRYGNEIVLMSSWIAMKRAYQDKGIGEILWQKSKEIIRNYWQEKGCKIVMIFTQSEEENVRACNFYRKVLENPKEIMMSSVWTRKNRIIWFFKEF